MARAQSPPSRSRAKHDARPTDEDDPARAPAWRSPRAVAIFLAIAAAGTAVDLWTKHVAFDRLLGREGWTATVVDGLLRLTLSTNPGIVFGYRLPGWVVLAATLAAMAAVVALFAASERRFRGLQAGLAMVLGGAAGNLYDRLFVRGALPGRQPAAGCVRDFIDVTIPVIDYHWPVFNVADVLLVVGLAAILLHTLRHRRSP